MQIVYNIEEVLEFIREFPRDLVVLREKTAASGERLRSYALRVGGIVEAHGFGEIRSIRYAPGVTNSTALSLCPLPFHTDGSFLQQPPRRFMLSCIIDDGGGGGSNIFYPLDELLAILPQWAEEAFRTADFLFPQTYDGDLARSWAGTVLSTGDDGCSRIRWRSDHLFRPAVVHAHGTRAAEAVTWLHEHLQKAQPIKYLSRPGDTILVPNESMLHGRTALTEESQRLVLRVWVG